MITGDFNIWVDDRTDRNARQFLDLLFMFGMKQHVQESTHRYGHTLDLLISRESENVLSDVAILPGLSDHFAIQCNLLLRKPKAVRQSIVTRNLKLMDRAKFQTGVHAALSSIDFEHNDVSSCVNRYENSLHSLLDQLAPKKT